MNKLKNKEYSNIPFMLMLTMVMAAQAIIIYKLAGWGDYDSHNNVARYLFVHELTWEECSWEIGIFPYPLYHAILKIIHMISHLDYEICTAMLMVLCNFVSIMLVKEIMKKVCGNNAESYFIDFISIFSIIFLSCRGPWTGWYFYDTIDGPSPIHNPTIIMVRPFMLWTLLEFCELIKKYNLNSKVDTKKLVMFAIGSLLAAAAKPSFAVIFYPIMGIYVFVKMIKNADIMLGVKLALAILPSVLLLLFQYWWISTLTEKLDTTIHFGSYTHLSTAQVFIVTLTMIPVPLILFNYNRLKEDIYYLVAVGGFVCGWLQMYFLDQGPDGNYAWGYSLAVFFLTFISMSEMISDRNKTKRIKFLVCLAIFIYQAFVGVLYLYFLYKNGVIGI